MISVNLYNIQFLKLFSCPLLHAVIECGPLSAPHAGSVRFNGTTLWSEAVYSCDPGYVLRFGDEIRTCIRQGFWSGKEPCCIRKILHNVISYNGNARRDYQERRFLVRMITKCR